MRFQDRHHAGQMLGQHLLEMGYGSNILVFGLPRGGIPVAYEVATCLEADLDVFVVRKLGLPGHEELAMGAIGPGGSVVINENVVTAHQVTSDEIRDAIVRESKELERRLQTYRDGDNGFALIDKDILLVDDGLATGATMQVACAAVRELGARSIHVAAPVGAPSSCRDIANIADTVVCLETPDPFFGVGQFYTDFSQTSDEEVIELLQRAREKSESRHFQKAT